MAISLVAGLLMGSFYPFVSKSMFGPHALGPYAIALIFTLGGGINSVLVWHSYPNIGIDDRHKFDLIRALPGGVPALKAMVVDFHKQGVRVLFPMMFWD